MKIPEFNDIDFSAECIPHPEIMKLFNHRIRKEFNPQNFSFLKLNFNEFWMEINKLDNIKTIQCTAIPIKILKENENILGSYICDIFIACVDKSAFPSLY